jgi:hypothetical protein
MGVGPCGRSVVVARKPSKLQGRVQFPSPACHGEWRSLVAHPAGGRAVAGSNPVSPTRFSLDAGGGWGQLAAASLALRWGIEARCQLMTTAVDHVKVWSLRTRTAHARGARPHTELANRVTGNTVKSGSPLHPGALLRYRQPATGWRAVTSDWIWLAASATSSCSQMRTGSHPAACSRLFVSSSRLAFPRSFASHQALLAMGVVPCSGHECQKQPSMKTATRWRGNTMSARRRIPGSGATCTL